MSKKKKATGDKKKKLTRIQFLRDLYSEDPLIVNHKVLALLLKRFPDSKAGIESIITWKNMLRAEGLKIPKREVSKKKKKKVLKKRK